jgi:DNA-binding MarR family transcriptional regulator
MTSYDMAQDGPCEVLCDAPSEATVVAEQTSPPIPAVHRVISHLARRLNQLCTGILAEITLPEGITPPEYALIVALDEITEGLDQRGLADRLAMDAMTITQYVDRLEKIGLVTRNTAPGDRRVRLIQPTDEGRQLRVRVRPKMGEAHSRILSPLSEDERSMFLGMLTRVIEANEIYARPGAGRRRPRRRS